MTALQPGRYRRRTPVVEAVYITPHNIRDVAELVGGIIVDSAITDLPIIRLPGSIHPGRIGNYLIREGDNPWAPVGASLFELWHEPICEHCGR